MGVRANQSSKPAPVGSQSSGKGITLLTTISIRTSRGNLFQLRLLHLTGPCSSSPLPTGPEKSSHGSNFGPRMAAIRQRRSSFGHPPELKKKKKTHSDPNSAAADPRSASVPRLAPLSDGWQEPRKLACRCIQKSGKALVIAAEVPELIVAGMKEIEGLLESFSGNRAMPIEGLCAGINEPERAEIQTECFGPQLKLNQKLTIKNPFALLGTEKWVGRPVARRDANPGSSKQARPEETQAQRIVSKIEK